LVENLRTGIVIIADGVLSFANRAFTEMLGYSLVEDDLYQMKRLLAGEIESFRMDKPQNKRVMVYRAVQTIPSATK
jgi:PAS domain-containing protein